MARRALAAHRIPTTLPRGGGPAHLRYIPLERRLATGRCQVRSLPMGANKHMHTRFALAVGACLLPLLAAAQMQARFGPRGEIDELRVGGVVFVTAAAVALAAPGWAGTLADQRTVDPAMVRVSTAEGATVYVLALSAGGAPIHLREVVRMAPDRVSIEYELTPEQDVTTACVHVQSLLPAPVHAGVTRYIVAGERVATGLLPATLDAATHLIVGGGAADWVGFLGDAGSALRVTPRDVTVQLQDNRRWDVPAFGLLASGPGGRLAAGKTIRFALTFAADGAATLEAAARELARSDLAELRLADNRPLAVRSLSIEPRAVAVFSPVEVRVEVAATYENPFDPAQIAVDAAVTTPDGTRFTVPGFYYAPMALQTRAPAERLRLAGPADFRVRYTPTVAGLHRLALTVKDASGGVESEPLELTVTAGSNPGFVRVAKDAPRYFAYDSGQPFFAVGENVCWSWNNTPLTNYEAWFKGLGAAGGNWARLFLSNGEKGQEWMPEPTAKPGMGTYLGLGKYALDNAWRLDEVVRLAGESGIRLMFCLGTFGEFTAGGFFNEGCWVSNPYNAANGGPCASAADFWTSDVARRLYQQRLRYLIARWGHSPSLFAWEFWNEVQPTPAQEAWIAEMAAYVKRHDPNRHLVSTTYGSAAVWNCPDIDFSMAHMYGTAGNTADFTPRIVSEVSATRSYGKPFLLSEFGIDWQTDDSRWDPKGTGLGWHNGAWATLMSGAAGTAMLWYWDGYVHPLDVYHVLTPVQRFAATVDWAKQRLEPLAGLQALLPEDTPETFTDLTVPGRQEWGTTASAEYTIGRDGEVQGGPLAMTIGSPQRGHPGELFTELVWQVDMPQAGKVSVHLGQVCSRARLQIRVDGRLTVDRALSAGEAGKGPWKAAKYLDQYKLWVSDYDEDIAVAVPAGRHAIACANSEGDWLQINRITLPAYRSSRYPDVNLLGLRGEGLLLLWVHPRESTWRTEFDGKQPRELRGLRLRVPMAAAGTWRVEYWDTFSGKVSREDTVRTAAGTLTLPLPDLARDIALRLVQVE